MYVRRPFHKIKRFERNSSCILHDLGIVKCNAHVIFLL